MLATPCASEPSGSSQAAEPAADGSTPCSSSCAVCRCRASTAAARPAAASSLSGAAAAEASCSFNASPSPNSLHAAGEKLQPDDGVEIKLDKHQREGGAHCSRKSSNGGGASSASTSSASSASGSRLAAPSCPCSSCSCIHRAKCGGGNTAMLVGCLPGLPADLLQEASKEGQREIRHDLLGGTVCKHPLAPLAGPPAPAPVPGRPAAAAGTAGAGRHGRRRLRRRRSLRSTGRCQASTSGSCSTGLLGHWECT